MKLLVTGGAGFIGHHLVKKLLEEGDKVRIIDDLSKGKAKNLEKFFSNENFEFLEGDLLNPKSLKDNFKDIDIIYHLAAKIGGIGYFHKIPASLLRDNERLNFNVLEAAKDKKIKVVYLSSSMVYERAEEFPSSEKYLEKCPAPITSYGFSKLAGEYAVKAYNQEFGVPYVIVRPFNAYGPGEFPGDYVGYSHVIPDLVAKILNSKDRTIELLGSGKQTRCFTYAGDLAAGISILGKKANSDSFNIGTSEETRIDDLTRKIWRLINKKGEPKFKHVGSYGDDVLRRVPDCSKIRKLCGWEPKTSLDKGLKITVDWLTKKINK